jgi:hypothetical protein
MEFDALVPVFTAAVVLIGLAVAAMAVGVMFKRPCLKGSCGGVRPGEARCHDCPNR